MRCSVFQYILNYFSVLYFSPKLFFCFSKTTPSPVFSDMENVEQPAASECLTLRNSFKSDVTPLNSLCMCNGKKQGKCQWKKGQGRPHNVLYLLSLHLLSPEAFPDKSNSMPLSEEPIGRPVWRRGREGL